MSTQQSSKLLISIASPLFLQLLTPVHAATLSMPLDHVFSDESTPPGGTPLPWLTFTTTDTGTNMVTIEFDAVNLTADEHITLWYLNVDPSLDIDLISFTNPTAANGSFTLPTIEKSINGYRADADGLYDIRLSFATSSGSTIRFDDGDKLSYAVTYTGATGTLNASSFHFLSQSDPETSYGPFYSAAHVQSTGALGADSAWIAVVPEPSVGLFSLVATGAFVGFSRRRKQTAG